VLDGILDIKSAAGNLSKEHLLKDRMQVKYSWVKLKE
jgi:hypothetical protein